MHLFCIFICISGCASICLDIHLFCRSACSLFSLSGNASGNASSNLVAWLHICLPGCLSISLEVCLVARRFIWLHLAGESGRISVWSIICLLFCLFCRLLILLLILVSILFCHSVLPACSAGCASVACLNAYLPLSECLHCCSSIWLPFCLSPGISAQMSVLAAG